MNLESPNEYSNEENEENWLFSLTENLPEDERQEIEDLWPKMSPEQRRQAFEAFSRKHPAT